MRVHLSLILAAIAASPIAAAAQQSVSPQGSWWFPGTHGPAICLMLSPDGSATFSDGFKSFNPSRWRYDQEEKALYFTVGGDVSMAAEHFAYQLDYRPQTLRHIDPEKRLLVIPFTSTTKRLELFGYVFDRDGCKSGTPNADSDAQRDKKGQ